MSASLPLALSLVNANLLALGGALAAIPILIHLLSRRRVQRRPWAAMQWLLAAVRRHQRRLRLENWLVLLLRVLAVLVLGMALARPLVADRTVAGVLGLRRTVYLAIDNSYSMSARLRARSVADLALAEADALLSDLGTDDTLCVVATNDPREEQSDGRRPHVLVPRSAGADARRRAKEAVAALRPRDAPADWGETLERLRQQTRDEDTNRLVVLVTDFQARDWIPAARTGLDPVLEGLRRLLATGTPVRIVDVGGAERRNLVVARITSALRRDAFLNLPLRVSATIQNQGPQPVDGAQVSLFLGDEPAPRRRATLPRLEAVDPTTGAADAATVTLDLPGRALERPGSHVLRIEVSPPHADPDADALRLDSTRWFALSVRDRIRVLAWTRTSRQAPLGAEAYLRGIYERFDLDAAGRPVERNPRYELRTASTEGALADLLSSRGDDRFDLVVLANVTPRGPGVDALRSFVRGGGALLVFVGDAIDDPAALNEPFHDPPEQRLLPFPFEAREVRDPRLEGQSPFLLDLEHDTGHPLAEPFVGEQAATWIGLVPPHIWGRLPFRETTRPLTPGDGEGPPRDRDPGRVVLRFADGSPAFVEGASGLGRTLWVATSLDQGWFERALPFFLPVFLDEAAVYLTRPVESRRNLEVGRRILVTWLGRDVSDERFLGPGPGGAEREPSREDGPTEADRPLLVLDRVGTAGVWRLTYERDAVGGGRERAEEHFAVNPDPGEGALRGATEAALRGRLPPEADLRVLPTWGEAAETSRDAAEGEISSFLLWAVLGLLVVESLLAWRFGRRRLAARDAPVPG